MVLDFRTRVLRVARQGELRDSLLQALHKSGSDRSDLLWAVRQMDEALDMIKDVVQVLENRAARPSLADTYSEVSQAVEDMRASSDRLARHTTMFERLARRPQ